MTNPTSRDTNTSHHKVPFAVKLGYSFGTFGESIAYNLFYIYFLIFLTAVVGVDPVQAGIISFIAITWDGISDPLVGYLSDNSKNKAGRRRPFIIRFCMPLAIVLALLFTTFPAFSGGLQLAYFLIMNILFWTLFTVVDVPYISLGGELSDVSSERTQIRTLATMWNFVGFVVVASGLMPLVTYLADTDLFSGDRAFLDPSAWSKVALAMGILTFISFIIAYFATKGREPISHDKEKSADENFIQQYFAVAKIREFHPLIVFNVISQVGGYMLTALAIHYFIYYMSASKTQISMLFLIYGITVITISPVIGGLANRFGKKPVLIGCNLINAAIFFIFWQVGFNFITIYFFTIGIALYFGSFYILGFAATYDIAEIDKINRQSTDNRQGMIFAFFSFMMKVGIGLGMLFSGILLKTTGFDESVIQQSEQALWGLHIGFTLIPASLFLVAALVLFRYPVNQVRQLQIAQTIKNLESPS